MNQRWAVLKFGGTSVSTAERWRTIAALAERRRAEGLRPLLVCSALAGMSDRLEAMLALAVEDRHEAALAEIVQRHLELGSALGLADPEATLRPDLAELSRLALGASLLREAGPRLKARVMAFGELLSTRLGVAYLDGCGIPTAWLDARTALVARDEQPARARTPRSYLAASCDHDRDEELRARLAEEPAAVVVTQGFIARNREGETVLLGRGGSDTSAAYFAARLGAERCEIWTDVPGLFTANPALIPSARLLRALSYEEAQEIATMGAKVLHPRSIPPLRRHRIPLHVLCTDRPEAPGTIVSEAGPEGGPQVKAVSSRNGITLVAMETVGMWQEVGFLAEVFACIARHGISVDSVSTSETNVTISLDPGANALDGAVIRDLLGDLARHCEPRLIAPAASISLVGRGIRAILHELGPVLEAFEELKVHMVTQSASDLNLTFFVDEEQSERLVRQLHGLLFGHAAESAVLGPAWSELRAGGPGRESGGPGGGFEPGDWWRGRREDLLALAAGRPPLYVYDAETVEEAARALLGLVAIDRVLYSVKANNHPGVLGILHELGLGFECVSVPELEHVLGLFPELDAARLLFTPNFATREEIERGFALGARVTIDNLQPLAAWPELFGGREIFLRLDPGQGRGHHIHVRTAGAQSKFGLAAEQLDELPALLDLCGARVVGLHAHVGSGIRTTEAWGEVALFLAGAARRFPAVRVLDLGGGLGVPERPGQLPLDLAALDAGLRRCKQANPGVELWMEPGRFLVAQAGVLLARVTQVKQKGEVTYVGVETGMNSLIRPALYGAYHPIVNLSRLDEPATQVAHVVGPICETGDILGRSRRLAPAAAGDVMLIAGTGAYGRVMSSRYNMREPAGEVLLAKRGATCTTVRGDEDSGGRNVAGHPPGAGRGRQGG
ncbi:MAG TPA: bifunctional aspartate kinase/diaminopimelate decarboxylase [Thermoanaerobaculia bacterium]|nr:bifunctional aspartate kinase/diaminopimelate decarboxylase [Thermoanaerobaculia bacterium]